MRITIPALLSFNGGYVDTAGFLALDGLFTAHVTGNFVTFGAAIAHGSSGAIAKLLALPVFCIVVVLSRMVAVRLPAPAVLTTMLTVKIALLVIGGALAINWWPFRNPDGWQLLLTGMVLVAAMAIQNAVHRIHLAKAPPSTLMTGTSTQIMIDLADLLSGHVPAADRGALLGRLRRMSASVAAFALGCAAAALIFVAAGAWVFLTPPIVAVVTLAMLHWRADPDIT